MIGGLIYLIDCLIYFNGLWCDVWLSKLLFYSRLRSLSMDIVGINDWMIDWLSCLQYSAEFPIFDPAPPGRVKQVGV